VYEVMLQAVSEEISLLRSKIGKEKLTFYDIDLVDVERLFALAKEFEVPFITTVKNDIEWMREEVRAIPFKILYKGTTTLYKSFIAEVGRQGEVFIYTYREDLGFILGNMHDPLQEAVMVKQNEPSRHRSRGDFSGIIKSWISLDDEYSLDAGESLWRLDTSSSEISTNHIGIEYWIDRLIVREKKEGNSVRTQELLMSKEYLDYLDTSMEFGRRTKEVPHIGSQLSVITDLSGFYNTFDPSMKYSIPDLKLKIATRKDFFSHVSLSYDIEYVEFGTGERGIATNTNSKISVTYTKGFHGQVAQPFFYPAYYEEEENFKHTFLLMFC